ncbi:predicted protein [Methanosarcina acetivorans C2A]|uniref:Uncharacterized protein n=1 Tax=Methanosarcina acetivorans (strain ATCC 35395 / DSM 2834 / JCM 12185 / C2A) TaxID=188937 RepID=Q8TJE7_METAC|nr:predicted protein [Methanosarcina acetivorans C2A]
MACFASVTVWISGPCVMWMQPPPFQAACQRECRNSPAAVAGSLPCTQFQTSQQWFHPAPASQEYSPLPGWPAGLLSTARSRRGKQLCASWTFPSWSCLNSLTQSRHVLLTSSLPYLRQVIGMLCPGAVKDRVDFVDQHLDLGIRRAEFRDPVEPFLDWEYDLVVVPVRHHSPSGKSSYSISPNSTSHGPSHKGQVSKHFLAAHGLSSSISLYSFLWSSHTYAFIMSKAVISIVIKPPASHEGIQKSFQGYDILPRGVWLAGKLFSCGHTALPRSGHCIPSLRSF